MKLPLGVAVRSFLVLPVIACGARGPLDDGLETTSGVGTIATVDSGASGSSPTLDAGSGSSTPGNPGSTGDSGTGSTAGDGGRGAGGGVDAGSGTGLPVLGGDSGLLACGTCVATSCSSEIAACLQDTTCAATFECIATTCLTGTGTSSGTSCFLTCAGGNIAGLSSLLPILTCITGTCGTDCGSLTGGLGGLGL